MFCLSIAVCYGFCCLIGNPHQFQDQNQTMPHLTGLAFQHDKQITPMSQNLLTISHFTMERANIDATQFVLKKEI